jgi:hypothetical protein
MNQLENYRSTLDYREILRILQKASALQENILWQTSSQGRIIIPIHHFEIDFVTREVVVYFDNKLFEVDYNTALYVKLDYHTSVFKVTDFRRGPTSIHFSFPKEIKTQELRLFPRQQFLPNQERHVSLRPAATTTRDSGNDLQARVLDISESGVGLIVSETNRFYLKNNRILWLNKLGETPLDYPIICEVVYINTEVDSKFQTRKQKELKVGLKLSSAFPHNLYQQFLS